DHAGDLARLHRDLPDGRDARGEAMTTTTTSGSTPTRLAPVGRARKRGSRRPVLYAFLSVMALVWLFPVLWAVLNSFRNYSYTSTHGYVSFGGFTFQNYANAWRAGDFERHFLNSVIIT